MLKFQRDHFLEVLYFIKLSPEHSLNAYFLTLLLTRFSHSTGAYHDALCGRYFPDVSIKKEIESCRFLPWQRHPIKKAAEVIFKCHCTKSFRLCSFIHYRPALNGDDSEWQNKKLPDGRGLTP